MGFFNLVTEKTRGGCVSCGLYKNATNPQMKPYGHFKLGILNIGQSPGEVEDRRGKPWQGRAGRLLRRTYRELGVALFRDCLNINAVNCRPVDKKGNNRTPTNNEINCCRPRVLRAIEENPPKVIVLLGGEAVQSVIGHRWKKDLGGIMKWRGWCIPDRDSHAWVCPVFHPSYVMRQEREDVAWTVWKQDLERALNMVHTPFPTFTEEREKIEIIQQPRLLFEKLRRETPSMNPPYLAFDIETTGIKPYDKQNHQVVCMSFCNSPDAVYVTPAPTERADIEALKKLLEDERIGKIAHNMKFEGTWMKVMYGIEVRGWVWDSMIAAHVLDNRPDITGLKFQVYVHFGIPDYDSEIAPYLRGKDPKNANSVNRVMELVRSPVGFTKLMNYCGLDSLFTYQLAIKQMKEIKQYEKGYKLFHDGALALTWAEWAGMRVDVEYCKRKKRLLSKKVNFYQHKLEETKLAQLWKKRFRGKVNWNSNQQLSHILYHVMKITPPKLTATGAGATDNEALEKINISGVDLILQIRRLKKIRDTYLEAFLREQVGGWMHPHFDLHTVRSYRSSSSSPNFQNIPKRDKEAMKVCRGAIYPRLGHLILSADFSGIEVMVACCYTKDERLIYDAVHGDMHKDMAMELYMLDSLDKHHLGERNFRQGGKNGFVFPQFYGDYYMNCAQGLLEWAKVAYRKDGTPGLVHLQDKGLIKLDKKGEIKSCDKFIEHVRAVEDQFWNVRYKGYTEWKERTWREYQKRGYVEMLTGFKCGGVMRRNEVLNIPIQGSAFHCLLWSFIEIDRISREEGWGSRLFGEIHDEMLIDTHPEELEHVKETVERVTTVELPKAFPWIIVPLKVEIEVHPVDGCWAKKESH